MAADMTQSTPGATNPAGTPGSAKGKRTDPERSRRFGESGATLNVFGTGFMAIWAIMILGPVLWVVLGAFKNAGELNGSAWSWPHHWSFDAFSRAWHTGISTYLRDTVIVLVFSVSLTMLLGAMAAYVLARFEFRGNRFIYYLFVSGVMLPVYLALVPLFFQVSKLHMLNTYQGLILVYVAFSMPFTVFFLHSFFRTLPSAVYEAALIDGASHTRAFFQVMLPMAKPGLISVGIFNILGQWNQYLLPVVLMQSQHGEQPHYMLSQGLVSLMVAQGYSGDYPALFAGMTIAMLPVMAVYLSFQRQVQAGLTAGTLK
ncbi:carbohydrate ABC transporter permease [Catenulispora sp. NL8]|uniref:Carbohydrate ABC transporter permease n=1 Tax=Catenulispora pinistramenti TaxID=2705254 RepID=A0ABS5KZY3_9ACTN|nr:carbohydrate ABC transporter permease [Catenulispora pinistramenti]MBS2551652.1 carbohydrate ABC transporter permease [Catenulispora pinistramenti]